MTSNFMSPVRRGNFEPDRLQSTILFDFDEDKWRSRATKI